MPASYDSTAASANGRHLSVCSSIARDYQNLVQLSFYARPLKGAAGRVDGKRQHHQVAQLAGAIANVVDEQRFGVEAERAEHVHGRLLLGDDLDHHLGQAELE